jgi:hypothetical protein
VIPNNSCTQFSEDFVEFYSLDRLTEQESTPFEEHFLLCEFCRDRIQACDEFVAATRTAASQLVRRETARAATAGGSTVIRRPHPLTPVGTTSSHDPSREDSDI